MKTTSKNTRRTGVDEFPGYPYYPDSDDIYNHEIEVKDFAPEDIDKLMRNINDNGVSNSIDKISHPVSDIVSRE